MQTVAIGNPGNTGDTAVNVDGTSGYGAVPYEFRIGQFEVTMGQYTEFLNSVATIIRPYWGSPESTINEHIGDLWTRSGGGLDSYDPTWRYRDWEIPGIDRRGQGIPENPYIFSVTGNPDLPVYGISWMRAARFCNWLHNGATKNSDTESGAYTLNGARGTSYNYETGEWEDSNERFLKNPDAKWWIPSENEWYKSAYYDPTLHKGLGGYHLYPTMQSIITPSIPPGPANSANIDGAVRSSRGHSLATPVGSYTRSGSYYETFDQGGNVNELTDSFRTINPEYPNTYVIRGGSYNLQSPYSASTRSWYQGLAWNADQVGFRVATTQKEIEIEIELVDQNEGIKIENDDTAWITGDSPPKMPSLVATLKGGSATDQITWKFTCIYNRPRRPRLAQDKVELSPKKTLMGNQSWDIYNDYKDLPLGYFGGDAVLSCKVGTEPEQTLKFKILGKNPAEKDLRDYIEKSREIIAPDAWFAYALPKIESRYKGAARGYNQFYNGESGVYKSKKGTVVFGPDPTGPGGYGLFQITVTSPLIPREQIWNWQKNVDAGLELLNAKFKEADRRIASLRRMANSEAKTFAHENVSARPPQISFPRDKGDPLIMNGGDSKYGFPRKPNITFKDADATIIPSPTAYPTIRDAQAMRRFNGGSFCYWIRGKKNKNGKLTSLGHWQFNGQRSWKNKDGTTHIDTKSYVNEVCEKLDSDAIDYPAPHVVAPPKAKK